MIQQLLDMIRQWRFWKHKRRRRRTLSTPSLDNIALPPGATVVDPAYLDLAVSAENLWLVEEELQTMEKNIARLLHKLSQQPDDVASSSDEECLVCITGRSCMQTYPCGHRVLCRKCFIKTIQVAVHDRALPLRCVLCRTKIIRLKHQPMTRRVIIQHQKYPPVPTLFSSSSYGVRSSARL